MKDISSITSEEYTKQISYILGDKQDQIQNQRARGVFDVETLDLDVLYKIHDIHLDNNCSKNCSDGHPSTIEINED